jgi:DNA-binding SARP family transcriptional activator
MLVAGCLGAALVVRGDPRADDWLVRAAVSASRLGAEVLRVWAETLAAFAAEGRHEPGAEARIAGAVVRARWCGLPYADRLVRRRLAGLGPVGPRDRPGPTRLRCLGPFVVERGGQTVSLPAMRPLPRALFLQLVLQLGQPVHREVLMDRLWPDVSVEAAAHRLHAAASSVRHAIAEAALDDLVLERLGDSYRLSSEGVSLDVTEFESALREGARSEAQGRLEDALGWCRTACELYAGDLLPEAGPSEWVVGERARLRVAAASAAYAVAALSLRTGQVAEALPAVHRALDLDPLRDTAWSLLAEVQTRMGDLTAAASTRRAHERLQEDLVSRTGPPPGGRRAPVSGW